MATFVLVFTAGSCWVLATPIFASPDEQSHVIHALAVARGELFGRDVPRSEHRLQIPSGSAEQYVTVSSTYRDWGGIECLQFRAEQTANCLNLPASKGDARAITYTARYFPAYYALVGLGANWYHAGAGQVYLMRFITVAIVAALVASCAASLAAVPVTLGAVGLFTAVTPMALFMAASVNGSGIEIAAATGLWCHGALLAMRPRTEFDLALLRRALVSMSVLCLTRPFSPGWSVLALLMLAWLAGPTRRRELARLRKARPWAVLAASTALIHAAWFVWQRPLKYQIGTPAQGSTTALARMGIGRIYVLTQQMIGVFGWLDTPAPAATFVLFLAVIGALVGFALLMSPTRALIVVGGAIIATIVVPLVAQVASAHEYGFIWQGRYTLPIAVAVPIIAGISARVDDRLRARAVRSSVVLGAALVLAHALAFAQALRRYAVGSSGPVWFFDAARWTPPVPSLALIVLYVAALTGIVVFWREIAMRSGRSQELLVETAGRGAAGHRAIGRGRLVAGPKHHDEVPPRSS